MEAPTLAEPRPGPTRLWSLALWEAGVHSDGHHRERNDRSDVESIKRTAGRFGHQLKYFEFFLCFILSFTKKRGQHQVSKPGSFFFFLNYVRPQKKLKLKHRTQAKNSTTGRHFPSSEKNSRKTSLLPIYLLKLKLSLGLPLFLTFILSKMINFYQFQVRI